LRQIGKDLDSVELKKKKSILKERIDFAAENKSRVQSAIASIKINYIILCI